mmetsp:Transcript_7735/g.10095  ORF Transcript_7735/g.10095 Transcript_7735/m.10095 type:complete len:170 (+) Transcript_7735:1075-1584(+)
MFQAFPLIKFSSHMITNKSGKPGIENSAPYLLEEKSESTKIFNKKCTHLNQGALLRPCTKGIHCQNSSGRSSSIYISDPSDLLLWGLSCFLNTGYCALVYNLTIGTGGTCIDVRLHTIFPKVLYSATPSFTQHFCNQYHQFCWFISWHPKLQVRRITYYPKIFYQQSWI